MNQKEMEMAISQLNHRFLTEDLMSKEEYLIKIKEIEIQHLEHTIKLKNKEK
tara:strand:+ start:274 stop:429 length:156 start_codon:yes stop_codon:yes gene_type:complete